MKLLYILLLLVPTHLFAQLPRIEFTSIGSEVSFRGMSVPNDNVIWIGGSKGTVCRSVDGGVSFECKSVPGFDSSEFRSIYAFNADSAIICNIGSPAKILITSNGGVNWKEVYSNEHIAAFIDGIDFWNERDGIVYGDPIDGSMMLLVTNDGGYTWNEIPEETRPQLVPGETCFAASGTGVRCMNDSIVVIASGGVASRLFISGDLGKNWKWVSTPILQGQSSTGIFSLVFSDPQHGIIVGGDYKIDSLKQDHVFLTNDSGNNWQLPKQSTRGYRECVEFIGEKQLLAVGPTGIDFSPNGGLTWEALSD